MGGEGEASVAAQFAALGYHVYVPAFSKPESDLIVDINGRLVRIQVKSNSGTSNNLRYSAWHKTNRDYIGAVDWLAFHSTAHKVTAFLRPEEAGVYPTICYDDPPTGKRLRRNYAADYPITRVLEEV